MNRNFHKFRKFRKWTTFTAWIGIAAMVLAQFAVSSYACPMVQSSFVAVVAASIDSADCCAHGSTTGLCHEHCKDSKLMSADALPVLPDFVAAFAVILPPVEIATALLRVESRAAPLPRPPPLAILNCCFRI